MLERYGPTYQRNPAKLNIKSIFTYLHFYTLNNFANEDGRQVADQDDTVGFRIWPITCFEFHRPYLKYSKKVRLSVSN